MIIEVGKEYRTCNGDKAIIYAIYNNQVRCIHGCIEVDGERIVKSWTKTGSYRAPTSIHRSDHDKHDIVAEWIVCPFHRGDILRCKTGILKEVFFVGNNTAHVWGYDAITALGYSNYEVVANLSEDKRRSV